MKLVDNWRSVLRRAHSMWAFILSAVVLAAPDVIYALGGIDTNPRLWWFVGLAVLVYGILGRLIDQGIDRPKRPDDTLRSPWIIGLALLAFVVVIVLNGDWRPREVAQDPAPVPVPPVAASADMPVSDAVFLDMAIPFVGKWEGLRLQAYLDPVGVPTVCYGETRGVRLGQSYTRAECDAMFGKALLTYRRGLHRALTAETKTTRLPVTRDTAYSSLTYNIGIGAAGKSTAVRRLNSGNIAGGCEAIGWWNKAGGRVLRGLVRRRGEEVTLCRRGLA